MTTWICDGCGLEHAGGDEPRSIGSCVLSSDEVADEEYGDAGPHGRRWVSLSELAEQEHTTAHRDHGRGLHSLRREPLFGIGQWSFLATTTQGNLLWDPPAYLDAEVESLVRQLGGVAVIATSHPHTFAAQISWSHAFDRAPVLVNARNRAWVPRPDPVIEYWDEKAEPLAGLELVRLGGHMPGSAVARTPDHSLLVGDTITGTSVPNWVSFQRNLPRRVPMSAAVVERLVRDLEAYPFDRLYTLGGDVVDRDAGRIVRRSARRHIRWVSGEFDHLT